MTDPESMASPQAENEGVSVKPKTSEGGDSVQVVGNDGRSEAPRNVQRRPRQNRRLPPRQNSQERQRPHNNGYRSRRSANPRGSNQNEEDASHFKGALPEDVIATRELRNKLGEKVGRSGLNLFNSYLRNLVELARFKTASDFLSHCDALLILPVQYRLSNSQVQNTLYIRRLLERFSNQLMRAELRHSQKRCFQIERLLSERVNVMKEAYDEELFAEVTALMEKVRKRRYEEFLKRRNEEYQSLIAEYKISPEEAAEADATVKRNEEARIQRRAEAEQQPKRSSEPGDTNNGSSDANEQRVFRRGQRRPNNRRPKPVPNEE